MEGKGTIAVGEFEFYVPFVRFGIKLVSARLQLIFQEIRLTPPLSLLLRS